MGFWSGDGLTQAQREESILAKYLKQKSCASLALAYPWSLARPGPNAKTVELPLPEMWSKGGGSSQRKAGVWLPEGGMDAEGLIPPPSIRGGPEGSSWSSGSTVHCSES